MPAELFDVFGLLLWALIVIAGILAFIYPFFGEEEGKEAREKSAK